MKKHYVLPSVIALGGVGGFILRLMQNRTGFDDATGLPIPGNMAGISLIALLVAVAALLALQAFRLPEQTDPPAEFPSDFSTTDAALLMFPVAGVFLMGLSGALDILLGAGILTATTVALPGIGTLLLFAGDTFSPTAHLVMGAFTLVSAVALLSAVLDCRHRTRLDVRFEPATLVVPVIALVIRLVLTYRVDSMNPSLSVYYVHLLTLVFLTLGFFRLSAFAFGSGRIRPFALYAGCAAVLTLTLLADLNAPLASSLLYLGGSAVLVGCLILLLEKQSERK